MKNPFTFTNGPATAGNLSSTPVLSDLPRDFVPDTARDNMTREELHKSIEKIEAIVGTMNDLRELVTRVSNTSRTLSKQLKDYSKSSSMDSVFSACIMGCSGFYNDYAKIEHRYAQSINKDYEKLNSDAHKYFKKVATLEKKHDSHVSDLDKSMKKTMPVYEKKAKKKSPEHEKYIKALSDLGSQIADAKKDLSATCAIKEAKMHRVASQILAKNCEMRFATLYEQLKICGPQITTIQTWSPFVVDNAPRLPNTIEFDSDEEDADAAQEPEATTTTTTTTTTNEHDITNGLPTHNDKSRVTTYVTSPISDLGRSSSVSTLVPPHRSFSTPAPQFSPTPPTSPSNMNGTSIQPRVRHVSLPPGSMRMPEPWGGNSPQSQNPNQNQNQWAQSQQVSVLNNSPPSYSETRTVQRILPTPPPSNTGSSIPPPRRAIHAIREESM